MGDVRLIDLMCAHHIDLIADTRLWPDGYQVAPPSCGDCRDAAPANWHRFVALPAIDPRTTLAVHEAGHAVVHLVLGTPVDGAGVGPERGVVMVGGDGSQWAAGTLAGAAAARRRADLNGLTSAADLLDVAWTAAHDFQMLHDIGVSVDDIARSLRESDALVAEHWDGIERVAAALLAAARLTGDEIARIAGLEGCA